MKLNTGLSLKDWALMFLLGIPPVVVIMIITWVYLAPVDPDAPTPTPLPSVTPVEEATPSPEAQGTVAPAALAIPSGTATTMDTDTSTATETAISTATPASSPTMTATPRPPPATSTPVPPTSTAPPAPTVTPLPTSTPTIPPIPSCDVDCVLVGATLPNFPGPMRVVQEFGDLSGRMPDLVMFFQAWGDPDREFKPWLPDLAALGTAPLITWEPWHRDEFLNQTAYTLESILAGQHDAYIDSFAQQAAAYGGPIYLRFAHEMNTPPGEVYWYPWQGDPETYIAVWHYVHDRFTAAGATNVQWIWSTAWMNQDAPLYYPGDAYVDWVAVTILNFGATVPEPGWKSFAELYAGQRQMAASFGKPVMISELASAEQGGDKAAWITGIGDALKTQFPEIRAIIWNNYTEARHVPAANWSLTSSPAALQAWQQLLADPYF